MTSCLPPLVGIVQPVHSKIINAIRWVICRASGRDTGDLLSMLLASERLVLIARSCGSRILSSEHYPQSELHDARITPSNDLAERGIHLLARRVVPLGRGVHVGSLRVVENVVGLGPEL